MLTSRRLQSHLRAFRRRSPVRPAGGLRHRLSGSDGKTRGRPVGVTVDPRGALIVADDLSNTIWRLPQTNKGAPARTAALWDGISGNAQVFINAGAGALSAPAGRRRGIPPYQLVGTRPWIRRNTPSSVIRPC